MVRGSRPSSPAPGVIVLAACGAVCGALYGVACADLAHFDLGRCGNGVLEEGEDCDTFVDLSLGDALACGAVAQSCRYVCTGGAQCPRGWTCSEDGACRHSSGCFDRRGVGQSIPAFTQAVLRDVNADGRADLVLREDTDVAVMLGKREGSFELTQSTTIDDMRGPFAVEDVDLDGRADLLVPIAAINPFVSPGETEPRSLPGLHILRGTVDGFEPLSFPGRPLGMFNTKLIALGGDREARRQSLFVSTLVSLGEEPPLYATAFGFPTDVCSDPLSVREPLYLHGDPPLGEADEGPQLTAARARTPSGVIAPQIALTGAHDLLVAEAAIDCAYRCSPASPPSCIERLIRTATISLPDGFTAVASQTFFTDIDGDAEPDLAAVVVPGGGSTGEWALAIARADGAGAFLSSAGFARAANDPLAFAIRSALPQGPCVPEEKPILAMDDFDTDGRADVVTPQGIVALRPDVSLAAVLERRTHGVAWTRAITDDFDGDGHRDVAAIVATDERRCVPTGIDLLRGDGSGRFSVARIAGLSEPVAFASGDFDGDGIADLAVVDGVAGASSVTVYFGATSRPFLERTELGDLSSVVAIAAIAPSPVLVGLSRLDDLMIQTKSNSLGPSRFARVRGSPQRALIAPLWMEAASTEGNRVLHVASASLESWYDASGRLRMDVPPRPTVVVASPERLWTIDTAPPMDESDVDRRFTFTRAQCVELAASRSSSVSQGMLIAVDKLEPEGFATDPTLATDVCPPPLRNEAPLLFAYAWSGVFGTKSIGGPCSTVRKMEVRDLDGNTRPEVVLTLGRASKDPGCGQEGIFVEWNVENTPTRGDIISTESRLPALDATQLAPLHSSAVLNADGDADLEIAVWETSGLSIVDHRETQLYRTLPARSRIELIALERPNDRVTLLAGDVDGDGLEDLVELVGREASVHRALAHDDDRGDECRP